MAAVVMEANPTIAHALAVSTFMRIATVRTVSIAAIVPSARLLDCQFDFMASPYREYSGCAVRYRTFTRLRRTSGDTPYRGANSRARVIVIRPPFAINDF
jgi:hypothetical protein